MFAWKDIFRYKYIESLHNVVEVAGSRMINPKFFYACLGVIFIDHTNLPDHRL